MLNQSCGILDLATGPKNHIFLDIKNKRLGHLTESVKPRLKKKKKYVLYYNMHTMNAGMLTIQEGEYAVGRIYELLIGLHVHIYPMGDS